MAETLAEVQPHWGLDLVATGPGVWNLRVTNRGAISAVFTLDAVLITGDVSVKVQGLSFIAQDDPHLHPGESLDYEVAALIERHSGDPWEKDKIRLRVRVTDSGVWIFKLIPWDPQAEQKPLPKAARFKSLEDADAEEKSKSSNLK